MNINITNVNIILLIACTSVLLSIYAVIYIDNLIIQCVISLICLIGALLPFYKIFKHFT